MTPKSSGVLWALGTVVVFSACAIMFACRSPKPSVHGGRIAAGRNEKAFDEEYGLSMHLPMAAAEFSALLERLGLKQDVVWQDSKRGVFPPPALSPDLLNGFRVAAVLVVYGRNQSGKSYRAYLDDNNQVVYIENHYAYPNP